MTRKIQTVSIIAIIVISLIAIGTKVFAANTTYPSYIDMLSGNTTLTGESRNYKQKNHKISFKVTKLTAKTHMRTCLIKDGLLSNTTVADTTVDFNAANKTYTYYMGSHATGKYYYYFSTLGQYYYGSFYADPVTMTSYD